MKPDNLPIKEAMRGYVVKLIDFDDSYFECNPPSDRENLVGTPEYYSPEQAAYIMDEDEEIEGDTLTCKSDIFTLGIIFSEYFSGEKPILSGGHKNTWTCINDGKSISFKKPLPTKIENLIRSMLSLNPNDRPSISEVFNVLKDVNPDEGVSGGETTVGVTAKKPVLRFGPGFKPSGSKGVEPPKTGTEVPKRPTTSPASPEEKPKSTGGLRGSGLKLADK